MTNQSFDNQVKQKMHDHESAVPAGMWEAIAQKKKKRRYPFFWWAAGAGSLITGIVAMAVMTTKSNNQDTMAAAQTIAGNKYSKTKQINTPGTHASNEKRLTAPLTTNEKPETAKTKSNERAQQSTAISAGSTTTDQSGSASSNEINTKQTVILKRATATSQQSSTSTITLPATVRLNSKPKPITAAAKNTSDDPDQSLSIAGPEVSSTLTQNDQNINSISVYQPMLHDKRARPFAGNYLVDLPGSNKLLKASSLTMPDSALPNVSQLVRTPHSAKARWLLDISVNSFIPVRQQQRLASVKRATTTSMHEALYEADTVKATLQPSFAYSITAYKPVGKRLLIGAGLQYGVMKEHLVLKGKETNTDYQIVQRLVNGSSGPSLQSDTIAVTTTGSRTIDAINSYRFLDIPLYIHYILTDKKAISLRLTGGVNLGLYSHYNNSIAGKLQPVYLSGTAGKKQQSTVRTEFYTGFRASRQLFKGTSVFAEPYVRFSAGKYANTIINSRSVHQAGVGVGVEFRL